MHAFRRRLRAGRGSPGSPVGRSFISQGSGGLSLVRQNFVVWISFVLAIAPGITLSAEQIPVRHVEGVTLGFLVLRDLNGNDLAYGELKQVVEENRSTLVRSDLRFEFKDGSSYDEITRFTQRGKFRLLSDQVKLQGPAFKQPSESWIDVASGTVTFRTTEKGKEKTTTKHVDLPGDLANGMLFVLLKNVEPSAETTVSYVVASEKPRVVKWNIVPGPEKTIRIGLLEHKAQHYIVKTKIQGVAGKVAPLVGEHPPDLQVWMVKSEAPTFAEFEGPLCAGNPAWRIEMTAPARDREKGMEQENRKGGSRTADSSSLRSSE
jgi:hypothetical protein